MKLMDLWLKCGSGPVEEHRHGIGYFSKLRFSEESWTMPSGQPRKRGKPPNKSYSIGSNAWIMHECYFRSKLACIRDHERLRRIWRARDAWLARAVNGIPPGALWSQKSGRLYAPYHTVRSALYPVSVAKESFIYGIVNTQTGKVYVGRTCRSPYQRFLEHVQSTDYIGRAIRAEHYNFVVIVLEKVPTRFPGIVRRSFEHNKHISERENAWIHRLDSVRKGYNSRVERRAPPRLAIPSHGFGVRAIRRSRHIARISDRNTIRSSFPRLFATRDWERRFNFLLKIAKRNGLLAPHVDKLKPKTVRFLLRYVSDLVYSEDHLAALKALRAKYLSFFPSPEMPCKKRPRLVILGFTSKLADVVPLRNILLRQNILSFLPPVARDFRVAITKTIPGFKYGDVTDKMFLNGARVGREIDTSCSCICSDPHWKEYTVELASGKWCVVTSDTRCIRNKNAAAVLDLQANFRYEYAQKVINDDDVEVENSFYNDIGFALREYVDDLCAEFKISFHDVEDWFYEVMEAVDNSLDGSFDDDQFLPRTGHIDFDDARKAFRELFDQIVIARVDKAANCLSVICKKCYIDIAKADEVEGDGYETIGGGEEFEEVRNTIVKRQLEYLKQQHLPAPKVEVKVGNQKFSFYTELLPTRYLMPKPTKSWLNFVALRLAVRLLRKGFPG